MILFNLFGDLILQIAHVVVALRYRDLDSTPIDILRGSTGRIEVGETVLARVIGAGLKGLAGTR